MDFIINITPPSTNYTPILISFGFAMGFALMLLSVPAWRVNGFKSIMIPMFLTLLAVFYFGHTIHNAVNIYKDNTKNLILTEINNHPEYSNAKKITKADNFSFHIEVDYQEKTYSCVRNKDKENTTYVKDAGGVETKSIGVFIECELKPVVLNES